MPSPWARNLLRDNPPVAENEGENLTCGQCGSEETIEIFSKDDRQSIIICAECGSDE